MNTYTKKPSGYLLHKGLVNGSPFLVIATMQSSNVKTGNMVQIWIILENQHPVDGVASGLDASTICRGCPFASGNGCYVNVGQAPRGIWAGYHRGIYPMLERANYSKVFRGRKVRFGAYGNPTLIPLTIVEAIASRSSGWTGYFHDWRENPDAKAYGEYFMASTETRDSFKAATAQGFRVFHASPVKPDDSLECLSETKGVECAACGLCAGLTKHRSPNIWINPHGSKTARANAVAMGGRN